MLKNHIVKKNLAITIIMSIFATYVKTHFLYYRYFFLDIDWSIIKKDINDSRGNR